MTSNNQNITFKRLDKNDLIPYDLLILADPSKELIDEYLKKSDVYTARQDNETLGVIVLFPLTPETVEIKNVAVRPELQRQGIGSYLIENVVQVALRNKQKSICIGTANSSVGQFYLYQKLGFEISEIKRDFFTYNYTEPIYENGIRAKHMLVMIRELNYETTIQQITIRKGQPDDLMELQQIFVDTISSVCTADYDAQQIKVWTSSIQNKERWNQIMTNQYIKVAQKGYKIIGFASLDNGNYVDALYVHKDYQRQGIAKKLYIDIEEEAKRKGTTKLNSAVSITARPFFEKIGFKIIKKQTVVRQNVELTNFKMMKKLTMQ